MADWPILSYLIWLPVIGGSVLLVFEKPRLKLWVRPVALVISLITLILSGVLFQEFKLNTAAMQFVERIQWLPGLGIDYALGVDGFSMPLAVLTSFMTFLVLWVSHCSVNQKLSYFYAAFLIMQGMMCGVFFATDAVLFYVFFEAMLIPMFLIIGIWGGPNRIYATIKFFLYTFLGSILLLIAIVYLSFMAKSNGYTGSETFSITTFQALPLDLITQKWLFFAFLIAFAVKVPMWPVHTWLPDAHVEAPTGGSVILAAITLKIGGYGFLRFVLPIAPDASAELAGFVVLLSLIAIVYIGLVALAQQDMKKLIAYSSISHMGFVTLGLFVMFGVLANTSSVAQAAMGLEGAMLQMISHGFISGALFFSIGVLYDRVHSRQISDYGGVVNAMPVFASFFLLFAMANAGLPGTSGFVGEFLVILSAFKANSLYAICAGLTLVFGAAYTLWMYKRVIFGKAANATIAALPDLNWSEKLVMSLLAITVLVMGLWPAPLLDRMHATSDQLVMHVMQSKL